MSCGGGGIDGGFSINNMGPKKKGNKHHPDGDIQTGGGKGRDQYGRKFGKKHASAMMDFTKSLWMQDATTSLRNILKNDVAQVTRGTGSAYEKKKIMNSLINASNKYNTD